MSDDPLQTRSDDDPQLPELPGPLRAELSRLYRLDANVPPATSQMILNRARSHLAGRHRILLLQMAGAAAAVAAVIAVSVWLARPPGSRVASGGANVEDVNHDGVVDIRDALALKRAIEAGSTERHDVNHDGVTDRRDVDAIAMIAVRLDRAEATR